MVLDPLLLLGCGELGVGVVPQAEFADVQGLLGVHLLVQGRALVGVEAPVEVEIDRGRFGPRGDVGGGWRGAGDGGVSVNPTALKAGGSARQSQHHECPQPTQGPRPQLHPFWQQAHSPAPSPALPGQAPTVCSLPMPRTAMDTFCTSPKPRPSRVMILPPLSEGKKERVTAEDSAAVGCDGCIFLLSFSQGCFQAA